MRVVISFLFEHCKFSAEQREGLAHELRDLGV